MGRIVVALAAVLQFNTACAGHHKVLRLDPALAPYVLRFEQAAASQGRQIVITDLIAQFTHELDGSNTLGNAQTGHNFTPTINIQYASWQVMPEEQREALMFHELGHAILLLDHRNEFCVVLNSTIPCSIMNEYILYPVLYAENKGYYIKELFSGK